METRRVSEGWYQLKSIPRLRFGSPDSEKRNVNTTASGSPCPT